jgi:hypothetical protein
MCQYKNATTHGGCGHQRTVSLITKPCDSSQPDNSSWKCANPKPPPPQIIADSKCWPCLQAQMGSQAFRDFLLGQLTIPETSEIEASRGRSEDWMDVHRRERGLRLEAERGAAGRVE